MITIELKEKIRKRWDFNIQVTDEIPEYMSSKEFKKIADVITSACNQLTKIRNDFESPLDNYSESIIAQINERMRNSILQDSEADQSNPEKKLMRLFQKATALPIPFTEKLEVIQRILYLQRDSERSRLRQKAESISGLSRADSNRQSFAEED